MDTKYSLFDFFSQVRMGIWQGGEVKNMGYLGLVTELGTTNGIEEWCGQPLSYDAVLLSLDDEVLSFALYFPYDSTYIKYSVSGQVKLLDKWQAHLEKHIADYETKLDKRRQWSHNVFKRDPFHIERRYTSVFTSIRTGRINAPKTNFLRR